MEPRRPVTSIAGAVTRKIAFTGMSPWLIQIEESTISNGLMAVNHFHRTDVKPTSYSLGADCELFVSSVGVWELLCHLACAPFVIPQCCHQSRPSMVDVSIQRERGLNEEDIKFIETFAIANYQLLQFSAEELFNDGEYKFVTMNDGDWLWTSQMTGFYRLSFQFDEFVKFLMYSLEVTMPEG